MTPVADADRTQRDLLTWCDRPITAQRACGKEIRQGKRAADHGTALEKLPA